MSDGVPEGLTRDEQRDWHKCWFSDISYAAHPEITGEALATRLRTIAALRAERDKLSEALDLANAGLCEPDSCRVLRDLRVKLEKAESAATSAVDDLGRAHAALHIASVYIQSGRCEDAVAVMRAARELEADDE